MRTALLLLTFVFASSDAQAWWGHGRYWGYPGAWGWGWHRHAVPVYWEPVYYPAPMVYWVIPAESCPTVPMPAPRILSTEPPARMPEKKPPVKGSGAAPQTPYSPIVPATMTAPMEEKPESRLPKVDVPTAPNPVAAETPKFELPKVEPSKFELPPLNVPAPKLELPPLPEIKLEKSTSKYRATAKAELFAVEGTPPADGKYRVNFFNTGDRDVTLMVNGTAITLPAKNQIAANVGRNFRWKLDEDAEADAMIPEGVAGAEVVIK